MNKIYTRKPDKSRNLLAAELFAPKYLFKKGLPLLALGQNELYAREAVEYFAEVDSENTEPHGRMKVVRAAQRP